MKEATGEVSGVVVTIVIIAAVLALGTWVFNNQGVKNWIENVFNQNVGGNLDFE